MRILIVEDDAALASFIRKGLEAVEAVIVKGAARAMNEANRQA